MIRMVMGMGNVYGMLGLGFWICWAVVCAMRMGAVLV